MPNDAATNPTPSPTPAGASLDFSAIPGYIDHSVSSMQAPQNPSQAVEQNPEDVARDYNASQESGIEKVEDLTKPIENYTPEGRAEHPILSKIGDVTRGVKELLEGGQAAGKPLGTSEGIINNPVTQTLGGESMVTEDAPAVLEAAGKVAGKVGSHLAETGRTFGRSFLEEGKAALAAKAPEGSLEAGFAKIPGYKKVADAPVPKQEINPTQDLWQQYTSGKVSLPDMYQQQYPYGVDLSNFKGTSEEREGEIELGRQKAIGNVQVTPTIDSKRSLWDQYEEGKISLEQVYQQQHPYGVDLRTLKGTPEQKQQILDQAQLNAKKYIIPEKSSPNEQVAASAQRYNAANNKPQINHEPVELPSQEERNELADKYDQIKHDPKNPAVARSFAAMKKETLDQFNHAKNDLGITFDFTNKEQPYDNAAEMQADVRDNHRLITHTGNEVNSEHPSSEIAPGTGQTYQSIFHAVHDLNGHVAGGNDFSEAGEHNAYNVHTQMYSDDAKPAVRALTEGQSNWFFNNRDVRNGAEPGKFAEQKVGIFPPETGRSFVPANRDEYAQAVASSPHAASLSQVSDNPAHIFQMTEGGKKTPVYYSVNPDGEIAGIVNNSGGSTKNALDDIMPHAIEHGGNHLDAWDIQNKLPKKYEKYGFKTDKISPYDATTYGEPTDALKKSWTDSGWKEGEPYPSVVHMSLPTEEEGGDPNLGADEREPEDGDTSFNHGANAYHPDLQKLVDKYGETDDPYKIGNGKSFITPSGKFVHINSLTHDEALGQVGVHSEGDNRKDFILNTGAIRTNFEPFHRAGKTFTASVPKEVTPEQIQALKEATYKAVGKNGNIVVERADITPETKDKLSQTKEFGNANHIEQMLKDIDAHPGPKPWMDAAAEKAKTGGFTTHPGTGETPTKGLVSEVGTEQRRDLGHTPTAEDIQQYTKDHADLLAKHPELHVGGFGNELNISAVGKGAERVAKKLGLQSAYDLGEGREIDTGGTGKRTDFPNYPMEDRLKDIAGEPQSNIPGFEHLSKDFYNNLEPYERDDLRDNTRLQNIAMQKYHTDNPDAPTVSTRVPSRTVKGETVENHLNQSRTSDMEAAKAAPGYVQKMVDRVKNVPGVVMSKGEDALASANKYIRHVADNVKFVNGKLDDAYRKLNEQWYPVGAHERVQALAKEHGYTPNQVAGVIAVESPLSDWDANTSRAERTVSIWKNQQNTKWTPEMTAAADKISSIPANKGFKALFEPLKGKTLGELPNVKDQALWLRAYDEAHNSRDYQAWNPDGTSNGIVKKADGTPERMGWAFQSHIEKAIRILKDGSPESISRELGYGHKVRNFYNNIIAPNDPRYLTIDTHAVAVGQLRPLSGKHPDVAINFGGIGNGPRGLSGTYPLNDAGFRLAAKELDIPIPSRLQSPVWAKIREVFSDNFKTEENLNAIDAIWKEHSDGKITADQARNKVWDYATEWHARNAGTNGVASDAGELPKSGVSGEPAARATGRGTGSGATEGLASKKSGTAKSNKKASINAMDFLKGFGS